MSREEQNKEEKSRKAFPYKSEREQSRSRSE
jgi:hypothetical protein